MEFRRHLDEHRQNDLGELKDGFGGGYSVGRREG